MPTGLISTYDLTAGVMLDFDDMIGLLDPFDVPMLGTYGGDGETTIARGDPPTDKKFQWLDDTLLAPRDQLNGAIVTADAFITVDNRLKFTTGDVMLIGAEYLRVTGYGTTAETLTVTRSFNSSTATTAADNTVIVGVGTALAEGTDPNAARSVDRTARENYTQIFGPYLVQVSRTEKKVRKYGLSGTDEWGYQIAKQMKAAAIAVEQAYLYGKKLEDTSNEWRTTAGLISFITVNVDSTTTDLTETKLLDQMKTSFDAGGVIDRAMMGSTQKRKVSGINSTAIRYTQTDGARGQVVEYLDSDFGRTVMILNRWMRVQDLFLFNRDQAFHREFDPLQVQPLGKTGDSEKAQVIYECGLQFERDKHAARFASLQA